MKSLISMFSSKSEKKVGLLERNISWLLLKISDSEIWLHLVNISFPPVVLFCFVGTYIITPNGEKIYINKQ